MLHFSAIGEALRWLRKERDLKQAKVAESAGITSPMLSAYETGKQRPSLATIDKILKALEADAWDLTKALLSFEEENPGVTKSNKAAAEALTRANLETIAELEIQLRKLVEESAGDATATEKSILFRASFTLLWLLRHFKS